MSDSSPSPTDTLVASASDEIARVIGDLVQQLNQAHALERDEAVALVRREAEDALRLVREESEAARLRSVEEAVAAAQQRFTDAEQALRDEASAQARVEADTLRAEFAEQLRLRVRDAESASAADLLASRAGEREQRLAATERLLRAVTRLDEATSLRAALDALAEAVAEEAPRSAVFVVRGDEIRTWRTSGLAADAAPPTCPLADAGPLRDAVAHCQPVVVDADALGREPTPPLRSLALGSHQAGLVAPVVVDGRSVAVVYADDGETSDREVPASWPEVVQVLARHTARCLESITARRAASARGASGEQHLHEPAADAPPMAADAESARRFARLVVSELKLYNEAAVEAGRQARDLRQRLAVPITRARQQYEARVPATLPSRDAYFEQELVRTLGEGDPELLGAHGAFGV